MSRLLSALRTNVNSARRFLTIAAAAPDRANRRKAARAILANGSSSVNVAAAQALADEGFAPWQLDPQMWADLAETYRQLAERAQRPAENRRSGKAFFEEALATSDLQKYPALLDMALEPRLLSTVMRGMGLVPHLESVEIYISRPNTSPGLQASQLWHRDVNDAAIVKLFVYLNDVGEPNGPFTFIPARASSQVPHGPDHYMPDAHIDTRLGRGEWRKVEGRAGTAFLIDTHRCLHFGSRCTEPRIAYISTYSSGGKFGDHARKWQEILGGRAAQLSDMQRTVCGLSS
jgi:hypothetical protein